MSKVWLPDYPPASAHASSDEFDDSSVAVAWTEWDVSNKLTVSEDVYGLSMVQTTDANQQLAGIFKAVPANDWAIWTKCSLFGPQTNYNKLGMVLGQDITNNPSTSDVYVLVLQYANPTAMTVAFQKYTAYNTYGSGVASVTDAVIGTGCYLRVRKASTTYSADYSLDGIGWQNVWSGSLDFTPAEMGLFINNQNTGVTIRGAFQFFRVVAGTPALTNVMNGKRVL